MGLVVIGLTGGAAVEKSLCAEYLHREWGATRLQLPLAANSAEGWRDGLAEARLPSAVDGTTRLVVVDDLVSESEVAAVRRLGGIILEVDDDGPHHHEPADGMEPDLHVPADVPII